MEQLDSSPVNADQIKSWTKTLFSPKYKTQSYKACSLSETFQKRNELSVQDGCLLWRDRVVIPPPGYRRPLVIEELHASHPGMVHMKGLACSYVWWPGMDSELENKVRECIYHIPTIPEDASNSPLGVARPSVVTNLVEYMGSFEGKCSYLLWMLIPRG